MTSIAALIFAAVLEIAGCFLFWCVVRLAWSPYWLIPACLMLAGFAALLTTVDTAYAGRTFAVYGGIYIAASVVWMRTIEGAPIDVYDIAGALISIAGALVILFGARTA